MQCNSHEDVVLFDIYCLCFTSLYLCIWQCEPAPGSNTTRVSALSLHLYLGPGRRYAEARLAAALGHGLPPQLRVGRGMETHSASLSSIIVREADLDTLMLCVS